MYLKTKALVLRVTQYNDHDALLTLLTPEQGKITAKARGLRRRNSPLSAPCQLLSYSDFTLFEYRGAYTVNEANSIQLFIPLRNDLQKLALGTYFAQVSELVAQEDASTGEQLSVTLNCLYALSELELPEHQIKAAFEFKTACIAGYTPQLTECGLCGNREAEYFDLTGGVLLCSSCKGHTAGYCRKLVPGVLDALRFIAFGDPRRLLAFRVGEQTLQNLMELTEGYLLTQLDQRFSTLDFYKSLLI